MRFRESFWTSKEGKMAAVGQSGTCCFCQFCERSGAVLSPISSGTCCLKNIYVALTFGSEIPTCDRVEIGDVKQCSRWKELRKRYVFVTFYDSACVLPSGTKIFI